MKKTMKKRIAAVVIALVMITALSASAFADGPQRGPTQGGFGQSHQMDAPQGGFGHDQQMGAPQGGFDQSQQSGAPQGGFGHDQQMGAPQGGFDQGHQSGAPQGGFEQNVQQPPEKPEGAGDGALPTEGDNSQGEPEYSRQPPEKPVGEDMTPADGEHGPRVPGGIDPMNQIISAVNELEDEDVKANIESLMKAHLDAMEAERAAEDDDTRAEAAEAVAAAQKALNEALSAAGIEVGLDDLQPPEKLEGQDMLSPAGDEYSQDRADKGQRFSEYHENNNVNSRDNAPLSDNDRDMFRLFQQFLEWLKSNSEE